MTSPPWEMLRPFVVVEITGDQGDLGLCRVPGSSLCVGMSTPHPRASGSPRVPEPEAPQKSLTFRCARKGKPKQDNISLWVHGGLWELSGSRGGRGWARDCTTKVGKISGVRRWGPTFSLSPPRTPKEKQMIKPLPQPPAAAQGLEIS